MPAVRNSVVRGNYYHPRTSSRPTKPPRGFGPMLRSDSSSTVVSVECPKTLECSDLLVEELLLRQSMKALEQLQFDIFRERAFWERAALMQVGRTLPRRGIFLPSKEEVKIKDSDGVDQYSTLYIPGLQEGQKPSIGVELKVVDDPQAGEVVVINNITPGSSAEAAGLKVNDIVVQWDKKFVGSLKQFGNALKQSKIGSTAKITIVRNGLTQGVTILVDAAFKKGKGGTWSPPPSPPPAASLLSLHYRDTPQHLAISIKELAGTPPEFNKKTFFKYGKYCNDVLKQAEQYVDYLFTKEIHELEAELETRERSVIITSEDSIRQSLFESFHSGAAEMQIKAFHRTTCSQLHNIAVSQGNNDTDYFYDSILHAYDAIQPWLTYVKRLLLKLWHYSNEMEQYRKEIKTLQRSLQAASSMASVQPHPWTEKLNAILNSHNSQNSRSSPNLASSYPNFNNPETRYSPTSPTKLVSNSINSYFHSTSTSTTSNMSTPVPVPPPTPRTSQEFVRLSSGCDKDTIYSDDISTDLCPFTHSDDCPLHKWGKQVEPTNVGKHQFKHVPKTKNVGNSGSSNSTSPTHTIQSLSPPPPNSGSSTTNPSPLPTMIPTSSLQSEHSLPPLLASSSPILPFVGSSGGALQSPTFAAPSTNKLHKADSQTLHPNSRNNSFISNASNIMYTNLTSPIQPPPRAVNVTLL